MAFCTSLHMASLSGRRTTEATIARWRQRLQEADSLGIWDQVLRPARNTMSRVRLKINDIGIDITSIVETGYMLTPIKK